MQWKIYPTNNKWIKINRDIAIECMCERIWVLSNSYHDFTSIDYINDTHMNIHTYTVVSCPECVFSCSWERTHTCKGQFTNLGKQHVSCSAKTSKTAFGVRLQGWKGLAFIWMTHSLKCVSQLTSGKLSNQESGSLKSPWTHKWLYRWLNLILFWFLYT